MTENCDCECKGIKSYTPVRIYNPSGLSSLSYRVGTHGRFKAQMVSEIASTEIESAKPLEKLTTRTDSDLLIALLDSWATIADVLSFYQERIANEGFLRTATERRSVLELARSIGYELRPGVAASTYLAFKMDASPTSPDTITIEEGTKVQSIPGKDETPQVFETSADIEARQDWSGIKPQLKTKQDAAAALAKGEAIFEGVATKLRAGDGLLFITNGAPIAFRIAKDVEVDAEDKQTIVTFEIGSAGSTVTTRSVDDDATIDSNTNFTGKDLNEILAQSAWAEPELEAKAELGGWSLDVIVDAVNSLATEGEETEDGIYAFRVKCSVFGHNAPMWKSLPPEMRYSYKFETDDLSDDKISPPYPKGWDGIEGEPLNTTSRAINKNSSDDYYDKKDDTDEMQGNLIYLDNTYPAIQPESWIALKDSKNLSAQYVTETREDSLTEFALAGKATGLSLDLSKAIDLGIIGKEFRTGQESPVHGIYDFARYTTAGPAPEPTENEMEIELELDENFPPINSTDKGAIWRLARILGSDATSGTNPESYDFRKTTVYAQPEQLALAKMSVEDETLSGQELVLEKMVGWLQEGQSIFVEGELANSPGVTKREMAVVKSVTHSMMTLLTTVELDSPLTYVYKRESAAVNANVAEATHGETKEETIGSGDPTQRFQSFALKQSPLTFISDPSPSGTKSTLEVKVDSVTWKEVTSFEDLSKSDNAYVTRTDNHSVTSIIFGDGTNGKLPSSGYENIKARYRVGIGMAGQVGADKLTLLMKRPLGVKSVTNPLAATGAADPEELDSARQNAPRTVLTLDRIVSIKDYADFARGFAGVGKATAYEIEYEGERVMLVAVASSSGDTVDETDELYKNLKSAIESYKDPTARFILRSYNKMSFDVKAKILVSEDREFEDIQEDVKDALKEAFSFESRDFGQAVPLSEVVSIIQGVEGVEAVDVESLYKHESGPTLESIIRATGVPEEGAVMPSLLLVNEEGITLEEMAG
jgi:hypothetical protein